MTFLDIKIILEIEIYWSLQPVSSFILSDEIGQSFRGESGRESEPEGFALQGSR